MDEVLTRSITLACPVEHAFKVFTDKIDLWWPRSHLRHRDASLSFEGEALIERSADGSAWTMGEVTAMEPPHLLALDWFPGSPGAPTSVEIRFAADGDGTIITVTHRAITLETKSIWPQRVARFTDGWDTVLPALGQFVEEH